MKFDSLGAWFFSNEIRSKILRLLRANNIHVRYLNPQENYSDITFLKIFKKSSRQLPPPQNSFHLHKPGESKFVARISNSLLQSGSGYVFDEENRLIGDFSSWSSSQTLIDRLTLQHKSSGSSLGGNYIFLGTQGYYHWLIEDLPAYLQARDYSPESITLIRKRSPKFVFELLELLNQSFIEAPLNSRIEQFTFASKGIAMFPNEIDVASLRAFQKSLTSIPNTGPKKIYVSRKDSGRYPDNEEDIESFFRQNGFHIVTLSDISLLEQISLFQNATTIAGTHGAGLANIVWCKPRRSSVIEIKTNSQPDCFRNLAEVSKLKYSSITSLTDKNWIVDIEALEEILAFSTA